MNLVEPGQSWPLGATPMQGGTNFAVFSRHAVAVDLCLFTDDGKRETARLSLPERDGDIWHGFVPNLPAGTPYGYRMRGSYSPEEGHRFNAHKLLMDPYARRLIGRLKWSDALLGYKAGSPRADLSFDTRDSAFAVPKAVVTDAWAPEPSDPPRHAWRDTVIYEAHAKGLTALHPDVPAGLRGTYLGLSSAPMLDHLTKLGVTAIELLPVQSFIDDRFLVSKGLRNYWGYQTLGFFAPEPRYMSRDAITEFSTMVRRFHKAGIEVLMDVVYNHSGEGDELGPTLAYRGLDNASYYRLRDGGRYYVNDTGTGNTFDLTQPMVLRMVMDSLRYWVTVMGVDGFRFDLASVLGREAQGFDPNGGFFDSIRQDPVLAHVKLIAEPWDIGPGGYQLGNYPHPFGEWNDQYRDGVRRFWRGDPGFTSDLAKRILGSADRFDHDGRAATSSVNFLTAHDGFTLTDLVSYTVKHNLANGEDNRDGHGDNHSDNLGVEGPTNDAAILAARAQRRRNLLTTLMVSQGTPMLLAGDEVGNSQAGNNNAYAQDNATGWVDWSAAGDGMAEFASQLSALRRAHPVLRQRRFLHARPRQTDGVPDVIWRRADGQNPKAADWHHPDFRCIGVELRDESSATHDALYLVFNRGPSAKLTLPNGLHDWQLVLDTSRPEGPLNTPDEIPANVILIFAPTDTQRSLQ